MCSTKAQRLDGLLAAFYLKHWKSIKKRVSTICLHIINEVSNITHLNHIYIALILKIAKPRKVIEFRSISLCNVIYRIITKAVANKLKIIFHAVIDSPQYAFIPNISIIDNIIVGYEYLHKIRHSKCKQK